MPLPTAQTAYTLSESKKVVWLFVSIARRLSDENYERTGQAGARRLTLSDGHRNRVRDGHADPDCVDRGRPVLASMRRAELSRSSPITGVRVVTLGIIWIAVVSLAAPSLGLYYETLAAWYTVPLLGLTYAYCVAHRGHTTALLAVVATVVAVLVLGSVMVIPKATTAVGGVSVSGSGGARTIDANNAQRAGVDLGPLPADAPPPAITSGEAVALASTQALGGPE